MITGSMYEENVDFIDILIPAFYILHSKFKQP